MKKAFVMILILAGLGLIASFYLIPRTPELALIQFKDKRFEEARALYEQQMLAGDLSPEVVNTLVDLYLQVGALDQAIAVMEKYLTTHPNDMQARQRLGQLYQFAQRPDDYLRNLEEINKQKPSSETLTTLSQIYNFNSNYDEQVEALKKLIALEQDTNPQRYIDLASIQASKQARTDAIETLLKLKEKHPQAFTFREIELLVSLMLDERRKEEAFAQAAEWRQKNPPTAEVARLVNLLHYKGAPEYADRLLGTYEMAAVDSDPALLEEKILLLMDTGQEGEAYAKLLELYKAEKLSPELKNRLLFMAIARGDNETANTLIASLDFKALSEPQALAILELAISRGDAALQRKLTDAFAANEAQQNYLILSAMLSVAAHKADAKEKLTTLETTELSAQQNLQVARICARAGHLTCTATFLTRLPEPSALTDTDVAGVGDLYLELRAYDKGYAFMKQASEGRQSMAIDQVMMKYAAIRGDEQAVLAWLDGDGKGASARTMTDLFFIARNHKQMKLAATLAERLYAADNSPATRSMLASTYVSGGQYAKAVTLLRNNKERSEEDENNYLMALTKLAKNSSEYRRELSAYAGQQLKSNIPHKRKMALIYSLVNAGEIGVAMPHIRQLALANGGQWAALYAGQLDKEGRYDEARQFWIALAGQPSTTDKQRQQIAYNLLSRGYQDDAEALFKGLAEKNGPESEAVQQLLYIWGPKLAGVQLDWLAERMNAAPDHERAAWAQYIANYATPEDLIPFAEQRHPEVLYAPSIMKAYVSALAKTDQLRERQVALYQGIAESGDPALIRAFGETAQQNDYKATARQAYEKLFQIDPNDDNALRTAGLIAFTQADYQASKAYLAEYLNSNAPDNADAMQVVDAEFYYAEMLRREREFEASKPYYRHVVQTVDYAGLQDAGALSKKAQALVWSDQPDEGMAVYDQAVQMYPQDEVLNADRIATLIAIKRYDEARAALAEPLTRVNTPDPLPQAMPIPAGAISSYNMYGNNTQALFRFNGDEQDLRQFAGNAETLPWVSYTSEGYRQLLITAKPGYTLNLTRDDSGALQLAAEPAMNDETRRQIKLRYELLAARIDLETGSTYAATERLNTLMPEYPNDSQLLGFAANAENYGGNWHRAQALLKVAQQMAPENEDIALLNRDIRRIHATGVKLDHEWVHRKNDDEHITTLSGSTNVDNNLQVGIVAQNDNVKAKNRRRDTGAIGNYKKNKQRAELYALYHWDSGQRLKASLFANNDTPGAGIYYEFLNEFGETGIGAEIRRPYWEYIEGVLDDATRDRISAWHTLKPTPRWMVRLEPGLNNYNMRNFDSVVSTWSFDGQITYLLVEPQPHITLGYGISAEYGLNEKYRVDALGNHYKPFPFRSREVHFLSLNTGYKFSGDTYGELLLGYGIDRLGGHGPMIEGRLTHELTDQLDAQVRAGYGMDTQETDNNVSRLGGYVRWRF